MKKYLVLAAAVAFLASSAAIAQQPTELDDNYVVRSTGGNIVYSLGSGKCVRTTNWEAGNGMDECAPAPAVAPAPVPVPVPVTRTVLSGAEAVVFFEYNKADLTPAAQRQLDAVAGKLRGALDVQSADIVGKADRSGTHDYNQRLSVRRAEAVKDYLAARGYINTQIVTLQGVGNTQAVVTCSKALPRKEYEACLLPDRKVELKLRYHEQVTE